MTVVAIDVETTGLGHKAPLPRADAVVQIGIAWRAGEQVQTWSSYCNPGKKFLANGRAETALRINGITSETIAAAKPVKTVAKKFWERIGAIKDEASPCIEFRAYNRAFDQGFLDPHPWRIPAHQWGDCVMLAAACKLGKTRWPKLGDAMQLLDIPWPAERAHDAAADAHAALLIHEKISGL